jgi:glycosyltransferase involved in cell wall biosynthesis
MRIGIDCRSILAPKGGEGAGVGHYTYFLVKHLLKADRENEYVLFFDRNGANEAKSGLAIDRPGIRCRQIPFSAIKRSLPFVYSHMFISSIFAKEKLDLLHAPANVLPLFYKGRAVVTVHDLAIYDHPEWFPGELPGGQTFSTRVVVPRSVSAATRVIAPSACTKNDLIRIFKADPARIDVIHEGAEEITAPADAAARLEHYGLKPGGYVCFVGTLEPRKNIPVTVRAFMRATLRGWIPEGTPLVLAGAHGWKEGLITEAVEQANAKLGAEMVRFLGYVPREDKVALTAMAKVFMFPSLYEGFGLPVIEAMRLGVPVITSNVSALPEICDGDALLIDPHDEEAAVEALHRIFTDEALVERLKRGGLERARLFTWDRTAQQTLEVYRRAVADKAGKA